jgi:hypothetical protein
MSLADREVIFKIMAKPVDIVVVWNENKTGQITTQYDSLMTA